MSLSPAELDQIIGQAATLRERLSGDFEPISDARDPSTKERSRWEQFYQSVSTAKSAKLFDDSRLGGKDQVQILPLFGDVRRSRHVPMPAWSQLLADLEIEVARGYEKRLRAKGGRPRRNQRTFSLPYGNLFAAISDFAWGRVASNRPQSLPLASARRGLQAYLARRICSILSLPLHTAFLANKALARFQSSSASIHDAFVLEQGLDGFRNLFLRFPVAARLVAVVTDFWIDFVGEFLDRLTEDYSELAQHFNQNRPLGALVDVRTGISEPHHGGKSVVLLTFGAGVQIVYKPRSLVVDELFFQIAGSLNSLGAAPNLPVLKILDKRTYGWMEVIRHTACTSRASIERFYQRAGALTCLVHWLQGTDCHRHNLVAAGEYPVLVDLETLGHPQTVSPEESEQSILRTGLPPLWQYYPGSNDLYTSGALGSPIYQRSLLATVRWDGLGRDDINWRMARSRSKESMHLPILAGKHQPAIKFTTEIMTGYRQMIRLIEHDTGGQIAELRQIIYRTPRRLLRRATITYAVFLRRSLELTCLREGIDRSLALNSLQPNSPDLDDWLLEIDCLEQLDVPLLQTNSDGQTKSLKTVYPDCQHLRDQAIVLRNSLRHRLILVGRKVSVHKQNARRMAKP